MCVLVSAHAPQIMGCGKSRLRSPDTSDVDLKKNNSNSSNTGAQNSSGNSGKNSKKNSRNGSGKSNSGGGLGGNNKVGGGVIQQQQAGGSDGTSGSSGSKNSPTAQAQSGKKKKNFFSGSSVTSNAGNERKNGDKEKEALIEAKPPSTSKKSLSNGKSARPRERNDEIGVSPTRPLTSATGSGPAGDSNERQNGGNNRANTRPYLLEVPNEIPSTNNSQGRTAVKDFKSLTASKIVHVTKSQIEFFKMLDEKIEKGADYVTSGNTSEVSSLCEFERH